MESRERGPTMWLHGLPTPTPPPPEHADILIRRSMAYYILVIKTVPSVYFRLSVEKRVDLAEKGLKKVNIGIENLKLDIERHDGQNDYIKSW